MVVKREAWRAEQAERLADEADWLDLKEVRTIEDRGALVHLVPRP